MLCDQRTDVGCRNLHGTFVSEKINKIRWRPEHNGHLDIGEFFVTGSSGDFRSSLKLWGFYEYEDKFEHDGRYPYILNNRYVFGDVTELRFLNENDFISASSTGGVYFTKITTNYKDQPVLTSNGLLKDLHYYNTNQNCSCTSIAVQEHDLVTVGEDGRINLIDIPSNKIIRSLVKADCCSLRCVTFISHTDFATGNLRGEINTWDLREKKARDRQLVGDIATPTCIENPTHMRDILVVGDELGRIAMWDLRQGLQPLHLFTAHDGAVNEISYDEPEKNNLYSCSSTGELWHWTPKAGRIPAVKLPQVLKTSTNIKDDLNVNNLMPRLGKSINSLAVDGIGQVICGCSNEAVYVIDKRTKVSRSIFQKF